MSNSKVIRIGGACGYWGESDMAVPQFLNEGGLDYIVFDYLAEITMSIMAKARAKSPKAGYATDFVTAVLKPNLHEIARQGIKIISNAGGVNPEECANAIRAIVTEAGLNLKVAVVYGDDLINRAGELAENNPRDMFSGEEFPDAEKLASINAYLGAFPLAKALDMGADIVVTGRCVDSAVTLAACIHEFKWKYDELDKLAQGSLAGHIIECGPQATGGNYTDWMDIADSLDEVGYPIAHIEPDGNFEVTKPKNTGGIVSVGSVGEQMLYEIGDPQAYLLPDVSCDFSHTKIEQVGNERVRVSGAIGHAPPETYKVCATFEDGWRGGAVWFFYGEHSAKRAEKFAQMGISRAKRKLRSLNAPDFTEICVETVGNEDEFGAYGNPIADSRSVAVKIGAKHPVAEGIGCLLKEVTGSGLATPPGLSGFAGSRSRPSPVFKLFSFALDKSDVPVSIEVDGALHQFESDQKQTFPTTTSIETSAPDCRSSEKLVPVPLVKLAFARSGDKGNKANVGILPRKKEYGPWIWAKLTEENVKLRFEHYVSGEVKRFYMPEMSAMNVLLDQALGGGGVASLRNDPQGKGFSQLLLEVPVPIPTSMAEGL